MALGKMEDLMWFKRAWEDHARQFNPGLPEEALIEQMHEYCVPMTLEGSSKRPEAWWKYGCSWYHTLTGRLPSWRGSGPNS
jgi:hypothetical protein